MRSYPDEKFTKKVLKAYIKADDDPNIPGFLSLIFGAEESVKKTDFSSEMAGKMNWFYDAKTIRSKMSPFCHDEILEMQEM